SKTAAMSRQNRSTSSPSAARNRGISCGSSCRSASSVRIEVPAAALNPAELDGIMSDYKKDSELMRLCARFAKETGPAVPVSKDLFAVLARAEEMSKASDGAFDITVGPVVQLWRHARRTQQLPDTDELAAAVAKVGYKNVQLDAKNRTVKLDILVADFGHSR